MESAYINNFLNQVCLDEEKKAKRGDHCVWSREKGSGKKCDQVCCWWGLHLKVVVLHKGKQKEKRKNAR